MPICITCTGRWYGARKCDLLNHLRNYHKDERIPESILMVVRATFCPTCNQRRSISGLNHACNRLTQS
jgi:hypothetical protein